MVTNHTNGMLIVVTIVIFLLIIFWRISVPLILAIILAKVVVALVQVAQHISGPVAVVMLQPLSGTFLV